MIAEMMNPATAIIVQHIVSHIMVVFLFLRNCLTYEFVDMFDSKQKDLMIEWLIAQIDIDFRFQTKVMARDFETSDTKIRLFLKQLDKKELIKYSEMGNNYVRCEPTMELYDFHRMGGFTGIEDELLKNIEKLDLELKHLKAEFPQKVETLSNASAFLSVIGSAALKLVGHLV